MVLFQAGVVVRTYWIVWALRTKAITIIPKRIVWRFWAELVPMPSERIRETIRIKGITFAKRIVGTLGAKGISVPAEWVVKAIRIERVLVSAVRLMPVGVFSKNRGYQ